MLIDKVQQFDFFFIGYDFRIERTFYLLLNVFFHTVHLPNDIHTAVSRRSSRRAFRDDDFVTPFHIVKNFAFIEISADIQSLRCFFKSINRTRVTRSIFTHYGHISEYGNDGVPHISGTIELCEFRRINKRTLFYGSVAVYIVRFHRVVSDVTSYNGIVSAAFRVFFDGFGIRRAYENLNIAVTSDNVGRLLVVNFCKLGVRLNYKAQPDITASSYRYHLFEFMNGG